MFMGIRASKGIEHELKGTLDKSHVKDSEEGCTNKQTLLVKSLHEHGFSLLDLLEFLLDVLEFLLEVLLDILEVFFQ